MGGQKMSWTPDRQREYDQTPEVKERKREYMRQWRAANPELSRELSRERARQWRAANPERVREQKQTPEYKERRRERMREYAQTPEYKERRREYEQRRSQDPERKEWARQYQEANRDRINEASRRRYQANHRSVNWATGARQRHGRDILEAFAAMWQAQDGCCYLCERPLIREKAVIDHDHAHCPDGKSCTYCRRGLACSPCNVLIGVAHDDPQLLRTIADNLESVLNVTRARIAAAPRQELLI